MTNVGTPLKRFTGHDTWDAIVVGSGIGGLGVASLLGAKLGKRVLVLERHYTAGGFTHTFHRPGYEWDVGVHYIGQATGEHGLAAMFREILGDAVSWTPLGEVYDVIVVGDRRYGYLAGRERWRARMLQHFPHERQAIDGYLAAIAAAMRWSTPYWAEKVVPPAVSAVAGWAMRQPFLRYARRTTREVLESLTRVGALSHDVGKAMNPMFFVENQQQDQLNTHEDLAPHESAGAIIAHVHEGIALAHKHRLPRRIDDFILEHHGTMITRYQYNQALEEAGGDESKVDKEKFRYPGPRPRSRETALLMLADGSEARARAERPEDEEGIRKIVRSTIEVAQNQRQLDETQLTLRDLSVITDVFVSILRGTHHPRISYPKESPATQDVSTVPSKR